MHVLVAIALKSLLIAGITLGLLALMKRRSSAERSWVAHIGLMALVLLALAPLVLPNWTVETPAMFAEPAPTQVAAPVSAPATTAEPTAAPAQPVQAAEPAEASVQLSAAAIGMAAYAVPAAILLFITFLALARLVTLRARADVLVDGHWLSALARAQRRMGFKHGTALLTSNELASPISWGFMRPVILLNRRAVEAAGEAEAIISHELAHVARFDWVKLLLARVATALFWFNPLVWMLAREAHQLREEAADDAVLAADIADTDYAQLLVGVARHECSGLLLGAHGVAPSKSSLARRVARVLDNASARGPVARSFALGVFTGAVLIAAPLAALTLAPARSPEQTLAAATVGTNDGGTVDTSAPYYPESEVPSDLPSIIADGVTTAVSAVAPAMVIGEDDSWESALERAGEQRERALEAAAHAREQGQLAREAGQRAREAGQRAREQAARIREQAARARGHNAIDRAIELKAVGVTPEYIAAMRAAAPRMGGVDASEFVGMKAVGVTPDYARDMVAAGFPNITEDQLTEARAVGVNGRYIRAMRNAGVNASLDDYVEMWAVGVRPEYVASLRKAGVKWRNVDQLVEMQALGITAQQLKAIPRASPRVRNVPPPDWNPLADPDPDPEPDSDGG